MAAIELPDLSSPSGLQHLDHYLLTKSYISGHQPSKDDIFVYCALQQAPGSDLTNTSRWYNHILALLEKCFPGTPVGVQVQGAFSTVQTRELPNGVQDQAASSAIQTRELPNGTATPTPGTPAPKSDAEVGGEDDDDLDLFGEETEEEKKASEEREAKKKTSGKKKESGKSSVLLDVKPWDDETDMVKLEEAVRSVSMAGLHWGASKLAPVGYGIKKLQIMMTIVDDLVSVDNLIEDYLIEAPRNEFIQSCDIVAFNKI